MSTSKGQLSFFYRPTGGLLNEREFLNSLAFRVFPCTQYIRHTCQPLYTPEPDLIHEFLGHACMFANQDFCDFSQLIGLASIGASDEDIIKLAKIYWFTIEFGLSLQKGQTKIYGGGILSSPAEIEFALSDKAKKLTFDFNKMSVHEQKITEYQTGYYVANSFKEMIEKVTFFSKSINKGLNISYNKMTKSIEFDKKISEFIEGRRTSNI